MFSRFLVTFCKMYRSTKKNVNCRASGVSDLPAEIRGVGTATDWPVVPPFSHLVARPGKRAGLPCGT